MKVVFIKPNMIAGVPGDSMEPLVFALLAALTPPGIERQLYDERMEPIPCDAPADLVALTVDVFTAKRAYQIAGMYRRRGIPVVVGGFHPSLCPAEAGHYADSVVVGDAEDTWPQVIADLARGALQRRYVSAYPPFGSYEMDRSIFQGKRYAPVRLIEVNRGCRFACDFCSIRAMYQSKVRRRVLADVVRDIDRNRGEHLVFTADNLFADRDSFKALLSELATRTVRWSCQVSADITRHPDLISLMARAGCVCVTLGLESLDRRNIEQMRKSWMDDDCGRVVDVFHSHGIMVYGTFIIGYDHDDRDACVRALDFAQEHSLFLANFNPLFPTPGTTLYVRLEAEGRLLLDRWWLNDDYRWGDCVFRPARMSPEELVGGCIGVRKRFNSTRSILRRFPGQPWRQTSAYKAGLFVMANLVSRRELWRKYGRPLGDPSDPHRLDQAPGKEAACM